MPSLEKITKRLGFKACCVASERTVLGAARLAGFSVYTEPGFTGNLDTDIAGKARAAIEALKDNDLVVLHFKATDLMRHDNNPLGKVEAIEKYNKMVGMVLNGLQNKSGHRISSSPWRPIIRRLASGKSTAAIPFPS